MKNHGHHAHGELNDYLKEQGRKFQEVVTRERRAKEAEQLALALLERQPFPMAGTIEWYGLWMTAIENLQWKVKCGELTEPPTKRECDDLTEQEMIRLWYGGQNDRSG